MTKNRKNIRDLLKKRILVLDGAMGTMLQAQGLTDSDFNCGVFANHPTPLKGDNDVLCITRPDAVKAVHKAYLDAGADIIETNTFNSNAISQAEYGLQDRVYELAYAGAKIAREAADEAEAATPDKPRFVAGSMGPTGRTASISPSVDDPASRNVTFDELAETYQLQAEALIDGGADLLLVETIFDTLNAKAAVYGIQKAMGTRSIRIPVMLSATLSDASGRMLAGQSAEAFLISVLHTEELDSTVRSGPKRCVRIWRSLRQKRRALSAPTRMQDCPISSENMRRLRNGWEASSGNLRKADSSTLSAAAAEPRLRTLQK